MPRDRTIPARAAQSVKNKENKLDQVLKPKPNQYRPTCAQVTFLGSASGVSDSSGVPEVIGCYSAVTSLFGYALGVELEAYGVKAETSISSTRKNLSHRQNSPVTKAVSPIKSWCKECS